MPLSGVTVNVTQGGLGRRPPNKDKISGLLWYSATLPSGFSSSLRNIKVFQLSDAEALGITKTDTNFGVLWYHISEYFRIQPLGELWIGIYAVPASTYDFSEIATMFPAANGEIKQLGIYANLLTYASSQVTAIQTIITAQNAIGNRASVLYAPNFASGTDWTAVSDLRTLNAPNVSVVTGEDFGGAGAALHVAKSFTISCLGCELGAVSLASVQQSIGNPANFNISNGIEMETLGMSSGTALVSATTLGALKDKGYSVVRKYVPDITGSYFERVPTAVVATNDYAWIEPVRTRDKAIRGVRTALIPQLQSNLYLKADGTLRDDTVGYFTDLAAAPLQQMVNVGELSNYKVIIDPTQNVSSTSTLVITVKIQISPVAEFFTLNIGLATSL